MADDSLRDPVSTIPEPSVIRARLSHCLRETKALRSLLRISQRLAEHRDRDARRQASESRAPQS